MLGGVRLAWEVIWLWLHGCTGVPFPRGAGGDHEAPENQFDRPCHFDSRELVYGSGAKGGLCLFKDCFLLFPCLTDRQEAHGSKPREERGVVLVRNDHREGPGGEVLAGVGYPPSREQGGDGKAGVPVSSGGGIFHAGPVGEGVREGQGLRRAQACGGVHGFTLWDCCGRGLAAGNAVSHCHGGIPAVLGDAACACGHLRWQGRRGLFLERVHLGIGS